MCTCVNYRFSYRVYWIRNKEYMEPFFEQILCQIGTRRTSEMDNW